MIITQREQEIIVILKKNPMLSQQEIADLLQITRSSVAVHITNLIKKGIIKGKGYVIDEKDYVSVIGGANMDIVGYPDHNLRRKDSNPGTVKLSVGGVGRNIAENLARLRTPVKMFSCVGEDFHGEKIISSGMEAGIDMSYVKKVKDYGTGTYLALLDHDHDMEVAISAMEIFKTLDEDYLRENQLIIAKSKAIVFDTNLYEDVFRYGVNLFRDNLLYLDTVSHTKALRAKEVIGLFHTIKPNKLEAEALSGMEIHDEEDLFRCADHFHEKGVKNVFITWGEKGVFYSNEKEQSILRSKKVIPKNATGAGDAFQAALVYSELEGMSIREQTAFSMAASLVAMDSYDTINKELSVEKIKIKLKTMEVI